MEQWGASASASATVRGSSPVGGMSGAALARRGGGVSTCASWSATEAKGGAGGKAAWSTGCHPSGGDEGGKVIPGDVTSAGRPGAALPAAGGAAGNPSAAPPAAAPRPRAATDVTMSNVGTANLGT